MSSHEPLADHVFGQQDEPDTTVPADQAGHTGHTGHTGHAEHREHTGHTGHTEHAEHREQTGHTEQTEHREQAGQTAHAEHWEQAGQYANPGPPQGPPPVRTGTMVWGLLALILGLGAMAVAAGRQVDLEIALISVFVLAGAGLLIGSSIGAAQRSLAQRKHRSQLG